MFGLVFCVLCAQGHSTLETVGRVFFLTVTLLEEGIVLWTQFVLPVHLARGGDDTVVPNELTAGDPLVDLSAQVPEEGYHLVGLLGSAAEDTLNVDKPPCMWKVEKKENRLANDSPSTPKHTNIKTRET